MNQRTDGHSDPSDLVTLLLVGDVMLGRGIDQVLPHPGDPTLCEGYARSALAYVALAEAANGPIPKPVDFTYVWGDALDELAKRRPDVRIVNLETAITRSDDAAPKGINYRMNPANAPVLAAAGVDCCALANNHVLDWGRPGLLETLEVLDEHRIPRAGAGRNAAEAAAPVAVTIPGKGRVLVWSFALPNSGVPRGWAATDRDPGINLLPDLSTGAAQRIAGDVARYREQPSDIVVASLHWGANWGYSVTPEEVAFAHALVDTAAVDVVHGHSSHHAKPIEVYRGKAILYGCGDFLNDYEGIAGYEQFRSDLSPMYLVTFDPARKTVSAIDIALFQVRNFRLKRAHARDREWLCATLTREGRNLGTRLHPTAAGTVAVVWG